ncbi:hypothetical protein T10_2083 [Trichinella papuae]|uniref:Uncharacterized protein n=1 Tax=Trichinella papuae TaxID=268474 RepID=A0A0V1M5H0_9BILA|nr:hypothetical protein T10_2083 [Trichinella papuae]
MTDAKAIFDTYKTGVFNGSARYDGTALNECLDAGPALQNDVVEILLYFRLHGIAVQADITQMFLQIPSYLPFQPCLLWVNLFALFGYSDEVETAKRVMSNLMESGEFQLAKWASNDSSVLKEVSCENKTTTVITEPLPYGIAQDWANWNRETKSLWKIRIPRWLILFPIKEASSVELHVSGDASKWAYGTMVYVKTVSEYKKTNRVELIQQLTKPKSNAVLGNTVRLKAPAMVGRSSWLLNPGSCWAEQPSSINSHSVEPDALEESLDPARCRTFGNLVRVTAWCF